MSTTDRGNPEERQASNLRIVLCMGHRDVPHGKELKVVLEVLGLLKKGRHLCRDASVLPPHRIQLAPRLVAGQNSREGSSMTEDSDSVVVPEIRCPSCGGPVRLQNQFGVCQCANSQCLAVFDLDGKRPRDGHRRGDTQPSLKEQQIASLARLYDYCPRRMASEIAAGRILGASPQMPVQYNGEVSLIRGPVSDKPQFYTLRTSVTGVDKEFCSGPVSGRVYQGRFVPKVRQHPKVELWAEPGHSGVVCQLVLFSGSTSAMEHKR